MKQPCLLALGVCVLLALPPRGEAQLNGEYGYNISDIFGTSPYTFGDYTDYVSFDIYLNNWLSPEQGATSTHNPKNGSFTLTGTADFTYYINDQTRGIIEPKELNSSLIGDTWDLTATPFKVTGKTYTDRKTKKSLLDTSGTITLKGSYTSADRPESNIKKGSLTFKASKLDCNRLYRDTNGEGDPVLKIAGSATLANRKTVKFNRPDATLSALYWGGEDYYDFNDGWYASSYWVGQGFYLDLNITTESAKISGTAKVYYYHFIDYTDLSIEDTRTQYPDPENPAKEFTYSVKGTSKNGIATLNLTGLGVIKGLKATIYIDEESEEIIQNGKNSITLYGQTITY